MGAATRRTFDFNHFLSCDLAMHEYWFHKTSKEYLGSRYDPSAGRLPRFIRWTSGARNVSSVVSEHAEMLASCVRRIWTPLPLMRSTCTAV